MALFRIHIRPHGGNADMDVTFQYCLENQLLGVGWRVGGLANTQNWDAYQAQAEQEYDSIQQPRYIKNNVSPDDLVWTRSLQSQYYLAKVTSGWEYWMSEKAMNAGIDIANIFRCEFHHVELDAVPGSVIRSFIPRRTIQSIHHDATLIYSQHLWNELSGQREYNVDPAQGPGFWAMLDPEETEDLVFLYLQSEGWWVVPNSRMGNTLRFEYMLVDPQTGVKALVQVKTGGDILNVTGYANVANENWHIFLFQSNGHYVGDCTNHISCITQCALIGFLRRHGDRIPGWLQRKFRLWGAGGD